MDKMQFSVRRLCYYSKILCRTAMRDTLRLLQIADIYGITWYLFIANGVSPAGIGRLT